MIGEFNILIGNPDERNVEVCFGPLLPDDDFIQMDAETRWPQLLKAIGAFRSTSQARKNGWNKDIEEGWSQVRVGRKTICVLKVTE